MMYLGSVLLMYRHAGPGCAWCKNEEAAGRTVPLLITQTLMPDPGKVAS
jgi:hypothetical protein